MDFKKKNKIITFHEVKDAVWFETVVKYLKNKYNIITAKRLYEFYHSHKPLENACLITVDDGHISSYDVIYPILKKYNVPAIFFVSPEIAKRENAINFWFQEIRDYDKKKLWNIIKTHSNKQDNPEKDHIDLIKNETIDNIWKIISKYQELYLVARKEPQNMTIQQVLQIDKEGLVEIGAHTLTHPFLAKETDIKAKEEIQSSIKQLEEILGHPVLTFAYPNGRPIIDFGEREKQFLKETSVKLAFSTYTRKFSLSDDVFAIPRYALGYGPLPFKMKLFLGKYYMFFKKIIITSIKLFQKNN